MQYSPNNSFCKKCKLYKKATHPCVMGRGDINAQLLLLGEALGPEENKVGQPFVGKSGAFLQHYLDHIGSSYYLGNAVNCFAQNESGGIRVPSITEIECCKPFTVELIRRVKPKVIVTLGGVALKQLIKNNLGVVLSRGKVFYHPEFEAYIVPTYHPSFILRNPKETGYVTEFTSDLKLARDLLSKLPTRKIVSKPKTLKDPVDIKKYLERVLTKDSITIDIETTGTDPKKDSITDISFCIDIGEGIHVEWVRVLEFSQLLSKILLSDKVVKIFHGCTFDIGFLRANGFNVVLPLFDTMVAYHTLTMSREGGKSAALYGLKIMAWLITQEGGYDEILAQFGGIVGLQKIVSDVGTDIYCSDVGTDISEEINNQNYLFDDATVDTIKGIDRELEDKLIECASYIEKIKKDKLRKFNLSYKEFYSAMDADVTHRIYKYLKYKIDQDYSYVFYNISMPLIPCLVKIHEAGVRINRKYVETLVVENNEKAEVVKKEFFKEIGYDLNLNSPPQLADLMYKKLGIKPDAKYVTKKGKKPSTDEDAIIHFSKKHPVLNRILDYRGINKETSTYLKGYIEMLDTSDMVYPQYSQISTATARLNCYNPNLHNVPRDNRIRNMVIPSDGCKLLIADLSQVELRVLAMMANDSAMISAFESGHDFHTYTACIMFNIAMEQFNKENKDHDEKRSSAKAINFGIVYQMRAETLAANLKIKLEVAVDFMNKFFTSYSSVARWINDTKNFARTNGYVETLYGRKRYLPEISSSDPYTREGAERRAVNTPIQSCFYSTALIPTITGYKTIKELYNLKQSKIIVLGKIKKALFSYSGKKDVYRYYFNDGTSVIVTPDHRYKTLFDGMIEQWKPISELTLDDYIISNIEENKSKLIKLKYDVMYKDRWKNITHQKFSIKIDSDIGFLLGVSVGNGSLTKDGSYACCFHHDDIDVASRIKTILNEKFNLNLNVTLGKKKKHNDTLRVSTRSKNLVVFLEKCGFNAVTAKYKIIPTIIWNSPTEVVYSVLCGMFTTDGTVNRDGASYTTTSKELAYELGNLLNMVGIRSRIAYRSDGAFNVNINVDFKKFNTCVGFFSKRKQQMTKKYFYKSSRRYSDRADLPIWLSKNILLNADKEYTKDPSLRTMKSRILRKKTSLSATSAMRFKSKCPEYNFLASGKYLKQVVSKEYIGKRDIYDVTIVNDEPQFIVNSALVHNSAGDISFIGIIRTQEYIDKTNKKAKIMGTIHDSILLDTPFDEVSEMADMLPSLMTINIPRVTIPLKADIKVLDMWNK